MKVNLISNFNANGLTQDALILKGLLFGMFEKDIQVKGVPYMFPQCDEADVNVFFEVINPSLFSYARKNIWIPNLEWTYRTWQPYLNMVDEIWAKTHECEQELSRMTTTPVRYIGWTSIDKVWNDEQKKNYHKAIVPVGKNIFRHPRPIFQAYMRIKDTDETLFNKLPTLHVIYSPDHLKITVPESIASKVVVKNEFLKETEYDEILKECGLCVCTSLTEGFGHAVNEAMSVGCHLILSPIRPFYEDLVGKNQPGALYAEELQIVDQVECMGKMVDVSIDSIIAALKEYVDIPFKEKKRGSLNMRELYEKRHKDWLESMKIILAELMDKNLPAYELKDVFPKEDDLPDISIVTLTKNRREFMPLAKYCYLIQTYPHEKLEWVIVDDGDDPIEDTLIGIPNVTYVRCDSGLTIPAKRNLGVEKAMYDTIMMLDDDDVYPETSILHRVAMMMKEPAKECAFCTTIPCYSITQYSSFMNIPPATLHMSERVSEATLVFTRKFWEENKFDESVKVAEGDAFIRGREHMCRELSPQEVIVSLIHPKNTSSRKLPEFKEPNGCHYGFNEKLFTLVSEIGEALSTSGQTASGGACPSDASSSCPDDRGDGAHP
jgi:hypothetical protein